MNTNANLMNSFSRFKVTVASTSARPPKSVLPELTLSGSKDKVRLNEKASLILGIESGEYLAFINNLAEMNKAMSEGLLVATNNPNVFLDIENDNAEISVFWGVTKGFLKLDDKGKQVMTKDEDGEEVPAFVGAKMANLSGITGVGQRLDGTDARSYKALGGDMTQQLIFGLDVENAFMMDVPGAEAKVYPITLSRTEPKMERKPKNDGGEESAE